MKAHLMYRDRDFDLQRELPWNAQDLIQDLELTTLFNAMALRDGFLFDVAQKAVLASVNDLDTIVYRQDILKDCLNNPFVVKQIYDIAVESIKSEKEHYFGLFRDSPDAILTRSVGVLEMFMGMLKKLKNIADEHAAEFESEGFTAFFATLERELDDEYFAGVQQHLKRLKFRGGVLISAQLGVANKGTNYVLRKPPDKGRGVLSQILGMGPPSYTFHIADRDDSGAKALWELKDRGINLAANALAQSNDHILSFFNMVRTELAFYVGCLNLHGQLVMKGARVSFPIPAAPHERRHSARGLYDVCLALVLEQGVVANDVDADDKELVIITGANQGGKSVFLRSIGLAQLMMQCGMFVPAEFFCANICDGLFTHFKREEDPTMRSGKLDEELSRMSAIVDNITPDSMLLFNESFAATNEREGSEIARQIVRALTERRIKVFFVTHLYEFAHSFFERKLSTSLFLRAERQADGTRTFKLNEGEPLQTSYGPDLYKTIFQRRQRRLSGDECPQPTDALA